MKRIVSTVVMVSVLALAGIPASPPLLDGSAAYAQASDQQIKEMIADLEKQLSAPRKMSAAGMDKTTKMLKAVSRMLDDLFREASYRGE